MRRTFLFILISILISSFAIAQQRPQIQQQPEPPESPWILNFLTFTTLYQNPSINKHSEEINFGYKFSKEASLVFDWGYSGLLNSQSSSDSTIWDPGISLGFKIPLSALKRSSQWSLLGGTSLVLAASPTSVNNGLIAGFSANLGFELESGPWTFTNTNAAYIYAYQYPPVIFLASPPGNAGGEQTPVMVSSAGTDLTFVTTLQMIRLTYKFNPKVSGKIETWYDMYFNGGDIPIETVQLVSTVGYYLTPDFRVFSGITTSTEVDKSATPPILNYDSTGLRFGFFVKW